VEEAKEKWGERKRLKEKIKMNRVFFIIFISLDLMNSFPLYLPIYIIHFINEKRSKKVLWFYEK